LTNIGARTWDPSRVHLSYHWLWPVPRELLHRSRNVPYQDGIRTSLGDAPLAPGAAAELQGRILAPDIPGLYWLQWDMVEEGVTWFAQVAPRQPRTLVVVMPPPAWALALLPLLIACWGFFALRPRYAGRRGRPLLALERADMGPPLRSVVAVADVLWCTRDAGRQAADPRARRPAGTDNGGVLVDPGCRRRCADESPC
jgi:hypothetical protein